MVEIDKSDIVLSLAGRDKGKHFFVLERNENFVLLADGKLRKTESPKRKKLRHVRLAAKSDCRAALKIRSGDKVLNSELRKALAEFTAGGGQGEGGL